MPFPHEDQPSAANSKLLAETFKAAGYATAHIGKWHLEHSPETMPNAQGFDHSFGHMGGGIDNYSHDFLGCRRQREGARFEDIAK